MAIDLTALTKALREDPAQREALRRALLGDEPDLSTEMARLAEAQASTSATMDGLTLRVQELAQAQARTETRLDELAQAQARTETRLEELAQAQARTEARVDALAKDLQALAAAQQRTEDALLSLVDTVKGMNDRLARLDGESFERRCSERGHAYFQRIARRLHVIDGGELSALVDDGRRDGRLSEFDAESLLWTDVVLRGQQRDSEEAVHLAVEASITLNHHDVRRARERADLLARLVDTPVIAVVIGRFAPEPVSLGAQDADVWQIVGRQLIRPEDDLDGN